ncbi:MAG: iron-sulfur cluster assembly scaffold protein [Alphaproteobacteria bacterium]
MNAPLYTTEILRLAASLRPPAEDFGPVDCAAMRRSPTCGSTVTVFVKLDPEGRIADIAQDVSACAFGQASAALVEASAPGRAREDVTTALAELSSWLSGQRDVPPSWPGFEALAPARSRKSRHGAILLPLRALAAAMEGAG